MLSAMSAEALKLRRHRATWMLVWIFPIAALLLPMIGILAQMVQNNPPPSGPPELGKWLRNAADFWGAPTSGLVRMLVGAFVAVVFAGEYGWNTWKLIVPHRSRVTLLLAKYVVTLALLYIAFTLAALIMMGMGVLEDVITGDPMPEGITAGGLAQAHWWGFVAGLPTVLMTLAYISLAAILTRSTVAAIVIGVVLVTLEQLLLAFGPALSLYLPGLFDLIYQVLPTYHLANLAEWARDGSAMAVPFPNGNVVSYGWPASLAIAAAWLAGLVAFTLFRFKRQDIN